MIAHDRPCALWRAATLAALAAVAALAAWTGGGALADPRPATDPAVLAQGEDLLKQAESIELTRDVGVAMFSWLTDVTVAGVDAAEAEAAAAAVDAADATTADWTSCPPISYDELSRVLVGAYLDALPRTDAWGHPFEYCLALDRPGAPRYVVGVRSPGSDGRWQGDVYEIGGFAPDELDRDLLWIDGYFVTWPDPR